MLTVKYIDGFGNESIVPEVVHVSYHEGSVVATLAKTTPASHGESTWTFGPNWSPEPHILPTVFVMNEAGKTIAKYDLPYVEREGTMLGTPIFEQFRDGAMQADMAAAQIAA